MYIHNDFIEGSTVKRLNCNPKGNLNVIVSKCCYCIVAMNVSITPDFIYKLMYE